MSRMSKEHDEVESWDKEQQLVPPCHTEKGVDSGGAEMAPGKSLKPVPLRGGTYPHAGSQAAQAHGMALLERSLDSGFLASPGGSVHAPLSEQPPVPALLQGSQGHR